MFLCVCVCVSEIVPKPYAASGDCYMGRSDSDISDIDDSDPDFGYQEKFRESGVSVMC